MKKLLVVVALAAFTAGAVVAQTPDAVKEKFRKDNPNAMGSTWKNEKDNTYRVMYSENKIERGIVYDKDGNVVSRQTVVKDASIPTGITEYYSKRATDSKEYSPKYTVWQTTDMNGNVTYYSESNGRNTYFDKDGKLTTHQGMAEGEMENQDGKKPIDK